MLLELKIRNLAIIESVTVVFGAGLNVITGETGAGKSILLSALDFVLGGRGDKNLIRTGEQESWVEALFDLEERVVPLFKEWGIPLEAEEPLVLRRMLHTNGRSRIYLNGVTVSLTMVRQLAPYLLEFGRQHEQSMLMAADRHLDFLDRYANVENERKAVEEKYRKVIGLFKEHQQLEQTRLSRAERMEFLAFQRQGIKEVDPQPGEELSLSQELEALSSAEKRRKLAQKIAMGLAGGRECLQEGLATTIALVKDLCDMDATVAHVHEDLQNALIAIEEAASSMQVYQKNVRLDANRAQEIQERLDQLRKLEQKYGGSFQGVMKRLKEIEEERNQLLAQEKRLKELDKIIMEAKTDLYRASLPLSQKRKETAGRLASQIVQEMAELAMPSARFEVRFETLQEKGDTRLVPYATVDGNCLLGPYGMENGYFYLSANTGEELRPLERVASGGELSRIMLGIKSVLSNAFAVNTFVFDEIDSGVAGAAATRVAQKLRSIVAKSSQAAQIVCISHTPQVAAEADCHLLVEKMIQDGRTTSKVSAILGEQRVAELARMLSGNQNMEQAIALAQELIKS